MSMSVEHVRRQERGRLGPRLAMTTGMLAAACGALLLAGCGSDGSSAGSNAAPSNETITATASSDETAFKAANAVDGDSTTRWSSRFFDDEWLQLDFGREREVAGLRIQWESGFGKDYDIQSSPDGSHWERLLAVRGGDGKEDLLFFAPHTTRYLRLLGVRRGSPWGYSIFEIRPLDRTQALAAAAPLLRDAAPDRHYEAMVSQLPRGSLPRWLAHEQEFWTIVGTPDDSEEGLFSEYGTVEPYFGSFTVTPIVAEDDRLVTAQACQVTQALSSPGLPLPIVTWEKPNAWRLEMHAVASGASEQSALSVRYRLISLGSTAKLSLILAVRPIRMNPPWQTGGASPIRSASFSPDRCALTVNDRVALYSLARPNVAWTANRAQGDVLLIIPKADTAALAAQDAGGAVSAALRFDLAPGASAETSIVIVYPQHAGVARPNAGPSYFAELESRETARWRERTGGWSLRTPMAGLEDAARLNLAYILLTRDRDALQPGARNYASAWTRDGVLSAVTLLRYRRSDEARRYMVWLAGLVSPEGYVPPIARWYESTPPGWSRDWKEFDAFGEFIYGLRQYFEYAHDATTLQTLFPTVLRVIAYQESLIKERRTAHYRNTAYYGLMPLSNSHEGYNPARHSYWDDFFALRGMEDAAYLGEKLGDRAASARISSAARTFRGDFYSSMRRVIKEHNLAYLPGCVELADSDPSSTAIALDHAGQERALLDDPALAAALRQGFKQYHSTILDRVAHGSKGPFASYEARNVEAFVRLGERGAAMDLLKDLFATWFRPQAWMQLVEVAHPDTRVLNGLGDIPHSWAGSDLLNSIRSLFLIEDERNGILRLAAGIPEDWLQEGMAIETMPTWWGDISYSFKHEGSEYVFRASGTAAPPSGFRLEHPLPASTTITVNGQPVAATADHAIHFTALPCEIRIK